MVHRIHMPSPQEAGGYICYVHRGATFLLAQMVKASAYNAGDLGSIPGLGRSPGEGNGNPLQFSCLENPMDRGAWQAIVHGGRKELDTTGRLHFIPGSRNYGGQLRILPTTGWVFFFFSLFLNFFKLKYSWHTISYYFRCATSWFDTKYWNYVSLVTIYQYTKLLQYYDSIPYAIYYIL